MANDIPAVLEYGVPEPGEIAAVMNDKLRFHTDSWDLSVDLKSGCADIVVIDARSGSAYEAGHIPGALSFPHREMNSESTARLDRGKCTSSIAMASAAMRRPKPPINSLDSAFA